MPDTPEQKARIEIDAKLVASGWLVQNREEMDLTAGRGIAVREFPMKSGFGKRRIKRYWLLKSSSATI